MRYSRFPWLLGAFLVVLIVGGIGFWLGAGSVAAPVAAPVATGTVVYPAYGWHWFGFPLFGLFFGLIFLFLIFGLIRRAAWGARRGGPGGYGRGPGFGGPGFDSHGWGAGQHWSDRDIPPIADDMLQRWHRRAHGEGEPPATGATPTGSPDRSA